MISGPGNQCPRYGRVLVMSAGKLAEFVFYTVLQSQAVLFY
jgi:hypothetical protein